MSRRYILRRARDGFREGAAETDPSKLSSLVAHAQEELITLKRQSLVYGLYARPIRNILVRWARSVALPHTAGLHGVHACSVFHCGHGSAEHWQCLKAYNMHACQVLGPVARLGTTGDCLPSAAKLLNHMCLNSVMRVQPVFRRRSKRSLRRRKEYELFLSMVHSRPLAVAAGVMSSFPGAE